MRNIFFIRHENDFEFFLPLISNDSEPFIVLYGEVGVKSISKIELKNLKYINIYRKSNLIKLIFRVFNKLTSGCNQIKFSNFYNAYLLSKTKKEIEKHISKIPFSTCSSVIFDHTSSDEAKFLVGLIKNYREKNKQEFNLVSAPHGAGTIVNSMTDYNFYEPFIFEGYDIYDLIICNDKQHFDSFILSGISEEKLVIISSLRYTKEWVNALLMESKLKKNLNEKINILIVHSKFIGNIDHKEVERCLHILNKFNKFNIRIKSHPRGGLKEASKLKKLNNKIEIVLEDIIGNIAWSDYVVTFGSSAIFDAFILNKPVIFPYYATSNEFSEEIMKSVICPKTPDEFYDTIFNIANGNEIKNNHKYERKSFDEISKAWEDILN